MKDVLAPLYSSLLSKLHNLALENNSSNNIVISSSAATTTIVTRSLFEDQLSQHYNFLSLFPCPIPHDIWSNVALSLLQSIQNEKLLWSKLNGGTFIALKDAYILERENTNIGSSTSNNNSSSSGNTSVILHKDDAMKEGIEDILLIEGLPIVRTTSDVHKALLFSNFVAGEVNPTLVRNLFNILREIVTTSSPSSSSSSSFSQPLLTLIRSSKNKIKLTDVTRKRIVFLLQYCISDLNLSIDSLSQLIGVSLLPLEDNTLGTIYGVTDAEPYFLVNEIERKILINAGSNLVASDLILSQNICSFLREERFSEVCNIRLITIIDVLKLICKYIIPKQWLMITNTLVDITGVLTTEWLLDLWSYIIEMKCIEMFQDVIPLLPVVTPMNLPMGCYLTKLSLNIPVLHMAYHDIHKDAVIALADLGIYIFNPSVLGSKSYSIELSKLISLSTPQGVLNCLVSRIKTLIPLDDSKPYVVNAFLHSMITNDVKIRVALQRFILDHIISKISDELTTIEIYALASLPIWSTCNSRVIDGVDELNSNNYNVLDFDKHQLYPKNIEKCFLNNHYIYLRDESDRILYVKLGIHQSSMGTFLATHVIPLFMNSQTNKQSLSFVSDDKIDSLIQYILRNLSKLERENKSFLQLLSNCPIFRCNDPKQLTLYKISSLYDPDVLLLKGFIPSHLFPSAILSTSSDPLIFEAMRTLGLKNSLDSSDILSIALDIQAEMDEHATEYDAANNMQKAMLSSASSASSSLSLSIMEIEQKVTSRACKLMEYLELNIERILNDCAPDSLQLYKEKIRNDKQLERGSDTNDNSLEIKNKSNALPLLGAQWAQELRWIRWVPVLVQPPPSSSVSHKQSYSITQLHSTAPISDHINIIPWSSRVHCRPLASPSQCNSLNNLSLCSATSRICMMIVKSELLLEVLGWNRPISGKIIL
jgi:hypothetical protein